MAQIESYATDYANRLLRELGAAAQLQAHPHDHPARRWAHSGAMALTGYPLEPAQMCPVPLAAYADGIVAVLRAARPGSAMATVDGARLLGERAALAGFTRAGNVSAGGSCRLLHCEDGVLAVNLARDSDWQLLPAWLEGGDIASWGALAAALRTRAVQQCVERGRLLGLAVAALRPRREAPAVWCRESHRVARGARPDPGLMPLVVDLSALWAGPLCTHLLQLMGARVIKVESTARPDGMRLAEGGFFDLLNGGKANVALDLGQPDGRARLLRLIEAADIVVEASRPRALRQLGIHAEAILEHNPGLTWVSITGHGREGECAQWVAFGDDAAVAGGLSQVMRDAGGQVMFCGDAIGDPLTGLHAALAAWTGYQQGGGQLLALALCEVVAYGVQFAAAHEAQPWRQRFEDWSGLVAPADVVEPRARALTQPARPLGADNAAFLTQHAPWSRRKR